LGSTTSTKVEFGSADVGPHWHHYLGDIIAAIPVPWKFAKRDFESRRATKVLSNHAADPYSNLDEAGKKKMKMAHSDLWRKFIDLALDESAEARWHESRRAEADDMEVGPALKTDLQDGLLEASGESL
jgi:hypothetical protein